MKHQTKIKGKQLSALAVEVGNLRYDALERFLRRLGVKLRQDAAADSRRGRQQLFNRLDQAAYKVSRAADEIEFAWLICKPHMGRKG